jgi:ankyrin repeat protein
MTSLIETIKSMVAKVYQGHANADEILYFPVKDYEYGTLLHYAVEFSLQTEVIQLLIAGCNTTIKNNKNLTAEDLAIENGNQQLIQFFQRFTKYRNKFNISHSITYDETLFTNHHHHNIVGLTLGCVYDDYIDWNNTTRTRHLQVNSFLSIPNDVIILTFFLPIYIS